MKFSRIGCAFLLSFSLLLAGCNFTAGTRGERTSGGVKNLTRYRIMGQGVASERTMLKYLLKYSKKISPQKAARIVHFYVLESSLEGVNHDVAFIQMCHETGFLHFGGTVSLSQNNFCGLGTMSESEAGYSFPDIRTGIRAHIQHLKAYGSSQSLANRCVDPRFSFVKRNSVNNVLDLAGKWAVDRGYGESIRRKIDDLLAMERGH